MSPSVTYFQYCYSRSQWCLHRLLTSNTVIPDPSDVSIGYLLPILLFHIPVMSPSVTYFQYCYSRYQWCLHRLLTSNTVIPDTSDVSILTSNIPQRVTPSSCQLIQWTCCYSRYRWNLRWMHSKSRSCTLLLHHIWSKAASNCSLFWYINLYTMNHVLKTLSCILLPLWG